MKVCVLGLGEVGLATAKYVQGMGLDVSGYDIDRKAVERSKKQGIAQATDEWKKIRDVEIYIICVSTTVKNDIPDLSPIFDVCQEISKNASPTSLVSIESTIIPGTSREVYQNVFHGNIGLVHVPHRYWGEQPDKHGVSQPRVMGAVDRKSKEKGLELYTRILKIPLHIVSSLEIAEMSKISENAYRYVEIAYAEQLRMICNENDLNFDEVREACNTKWNIRMLEARDGIGGHCLLKDTQYLASLSSRKLLLKSAIDVDKQYKKWIENKLR